MLMTGILLGIFAIVGTGIVALTFDNTKERIAKNEHEALLKSLQELVPQQLYNNDITRDKISVSAKELLGTDKPVTIYRARLNRIPVAAIISPVAPDGYNGPMKLLVAIQYDGNLMGVRVVSHRETPGLGDKVDYERSNWVDGFKGYSIKKTANLGWNVKKDGGIFDQFTGATITPRAVVKAVYNSLKFYHLNRNRIFNTRASIND